MATTTVLPLVCTATHRINSARAENEKSPILKLPNELLIKIGKNVFDAGGPTRIHGMVSRNNHKRNPMSLLHACSKLRRVLQPDFLTINGFVLKVSLLSAVDVKGELAEWWATFGYADATKAVKPIFFVQARFGKPSEFSYENALNLSSNAQKICHSSFPFTPIILIEHHGINGLPYFIAPRYFMRVFAPHIAYSPLGLSNLLYIYGKPPPGDHYGWGGWVATFISVHDMRMRQRDQGMKLGPPERFYEDEVQLFMACARCSL